MRIGILGGTFNPPHLGHRHMAELAVNTLNLDALYVVPAARPPHKEFTPNSPTDGERFEMAKLNFEDMRNVIVSDIEYKRKGLSYTVDTVAQVKNENPGSEIFLILGADMFLSFEQWSRYRDILSMCTPVVFAREIGQQRDIRKQADKISSMSKSYKIEIVENEIYSVSSTGLRELLMSRQGNEYLGESLYGFIIKNRLYGSKPNLDWLRTRAYAMLSEKRAAHVLGCEKEARNLAARWGADEGDAGEAAILHDVTKNKDLNQQLILCEKYDIIADNIERENVKLFHAKTGAAVSKELFGISGEVYDAILWHTTGRPGMGLLEQIIYIADYIEPTRDFSGVKKLRQLAYSDLRSALKLGLEMSISELVEIGVNPHPRTVETLKWLNDMGV